MNKPFTVTNGTDSIVYSIKGFELSYSHPVTVYKASKRIYLGNDVFGNSGDMKNFHAALGHAIETVEGLESE